MAQSIDPASVETGQYGDCCWKVSARADAARNKQVISDEASCIPFISIGLRFTNAAGERMTMTDDTEPVSRYQLRSVVFSRSIR